MIRICQCDVHEMPVSKKNSPDWDVQENVDTPKERVTFMKHCTKWLSQQQTNEECGGDLFETRSLCNNTITPIVRENLYLYTQSDINICLIERCAFCENKSSEFVLANPFSQRCYVFTCGVCV